MSVLKRYWRVQELRLEHPMCCNAEVQRRDENRWWWIARGRVAVVGSGYESTLEAAQDAAERALEQSGCVKTDESWRALEALGAGIAAAIETERAARGNGWTESFAVRPEPDQAGFLRDMMDTPEDPEERS